MSSGTPLQQRSLNGSIPTTVPLCTNPETSPTHTDSCTYSISPLLFGSETSFSPIEMEEANVNMTSSVCTSTHPVNAATVYHRTVDSGNVAVGSIQAPTVPEDDLTFDGKIDDYCLLVPEKMTSATGIRHPLDDDFVTRVVTNDIPRSDNVATALTLCTTVNPDTVPPLVGTQQGSDYDRDETPPLPEKKMDTTDVSPAQNSVQEPPVTKSSKRTTDGIVLRRSVRKRTNTRMAATTTTTTTSARKHSKKVAEEEDFKSNKRETRSKVSVRDFVFW